MQFNNRAIMAMIASALNGGDEMYYRDGLKNILITPDRNALIFHMTDGSKAKVTVTVEEVV